MISIPVLLVLVVRGADFHRAAAFRREMRWFAQAATRYLAVCSTPLLLLLQGAPLFGPDHFGALELPGVFILWTAGPVLVVLLLMSRRAATGKSVQVVVAVLINALPALLLVAGSAPIVLFILLQAAYAILLMPDAASSDGALPRHADRVVGW
ncbi:hypothetical protein [Kitasatospora sp. NPDC002040]|uniref:hypothetical protein n=1 Tax=Kitasatospora sp. NPDC002040 TaxID=3154661 RepID=UPI0033164F80